MYKETKKEKTEIVKLFCLFLILIIFVSFWVWYEHSLWIKSEKEIEKIINFYNLIIKNRRALDHRPGSAKLNYQNKSD